MNTSDYDIYVNSVTDLNDTLRAVFDSIAIGEWMSIKNTNGTNNNEYIIKVTAVSQLSNDITVKGSGIFIKRDSHDNIISMDYSPEYSIQGILTNGTLVLGDELTLNNVTVHYYNDVLQQIINTLK